MKNLQDLLDKVHHCNKNKTELENSGICGCYVCRKIFFTSEITKWVDLTTSYSYKEDKTAFCPYCDNDGVIGSASGYDITPKLLLELHNEFWEHCYR